MHIFLGLVLVQGANNAVLIAGLVVQGVLQAGVGDL